MCSLLEPIINSEKEEKSALQKLEGGKTKVTGHRKTGLAIFQNLRINKQN